MHKASRENLHYLTPAKMKYFNVLGHVFCFRYFAKRYSPFAFAYLKMGKSVIGVPKTDTSWSQGDALSGCEADPDGYMIRRSFLAAYGFVDLAVL